MAAAAVPTKPVQTTQGSIDADATLVALLVGLTVVTGLVDAFSYLSLGHVFVANMTGNVVFLAFALAGSPGFSIPVSVAALIAFGLGAAVGGRFAARIEPERGRLLAGATAVEATLLGLAVASAAIGGLDLDSVRTGLVVVLAIAMGLQNATARRLAIADLTTTVLTLTITGLAADGRFGAGGDGRVRRRLTGVLAMLVGAFVGAALIVRGQSVVVLVLALIVTSVVAGIAMRSRVPESVAGA